MCELNISFQDNDFILKVFSVVHIANFLVNFLPDWNSSFSVVVAVGFFLIESEGALGRLY